MKQRPESCWRNYREKAFTLVEVVASLMLLGTLLVGVLLAHRRHAQQIRSAAARLQAIKAADGLFSEWCEQGSWGTAQSGGEFPGEPSLVWRWSVVPSRELRHFGAAIGRLEVFSTGEDNQTPLAKVEVVTTDSAVSPLAGEAIR
jgi:hypothetical protein